MARTKKQESPIIRLTRFQIQIHSPKKGSKEPHEDTIHTFYGIDAEGNERVYAQLKSDKQFKKWSKTDPLYSQAQSAMFDHLLSNPNTRDTVIQINLQSALEKGDKETAINLWNALSDAAKAELMANTEAKQENLSNSKGNSSKRSQPKKNELSN